MTATRQSTWNCTFAIADEFAAKLTNYGSLFIGEETTVAYGDKTIGTTTSFPLAGLRVIRAVCGWESF